MTKRVTKKVEPLFKTYEVFTKFQLNDLFQNILNSTGIRPAAFKIPMLATVACVMKEPLPKEDGTIGTPSNNPNDYYPAVAAILDQRGQLKPLLGQIEILRQAETLIEKSRLAQKEAAEKENTTEQTTTEEVKEQQSEEPTETKTEEVKDESQNIPA